MGAQCCEHQTSGGGAGGPKYRRVLWIALLLNAAMFVIEAAAGLAAGSLSLQADAIDFLGDAANYGVSLLVLGAVLSWRAKAALLKGVSMAAFGLWVSGSAIWHAMTAEVPNASVMGVVGLLALLVNVGVAVLLYRFRNGDANMRSVWLCTRNDALSNIAVLFAALGVFGTGTAWPDLIVAGIMAALALQSSFLVIRGALAELGRSGARLNSAEAAD